MKRGLAMYTIKKCTSIVLIIIACFSLLAFNVYGTTADYNEMALVLNKLNILQGANGDFQLDKQLERAQATAFIIRMIGKEDYVKQNADQLVNTSFNDVPVNSWFAPYVGYGTQNNIIASSLNGKFEPFEYISEKAFLKMVLCALGYEYGEDFNWSNVYQKAYEVGLVVDESYIGRTSDNYEFTRASAVEIIYRALNTVKKGTVTKLAMSLADEGVFTVDEIYNSGIFSDTAEANIESVNVLAPNSIEVTFSEQILSISLEDITIFDEEDENNTLDVITAAVNGNRMQVITSAQTPGRKYRIEIEGAIDINSNICGNLSEVFYGYKAEEITSDFFRISKIEQLSGNLIGIYYTHPVNMNSEIPVYYEILENGVPFISGSSGNMTVKRLSTADNVVSVSLKNASFKQGEIYSVRVSGKLTSSYGARLGEGLGDTRDFVASEVSSEELKVTSVKAVTQNTVKVVFNREVDSDWAGQRLNYSIFDPNGKQIDTASAAVTSAGDGMGREVLVTLAGTLEKSKKYTIRIAYIPDIYKESVLEKYETVFSGEYSTDSELAIVKVAAEQNNCLTLWFNKALDPASATERTNYIISGITDSMFNLMPEKVYYTEQNGEYKAKLYLPAGKTFNQSQKYAVRTSNLKDKLGKIYTTLLKSEFTGTGTAALKPQIKDAVTVAGDLIKVDFNIGIAFSRENLDVSNYRLEYNDINNEKIMMVPLSVNYIDEDSIVLRFTELDPAMEYKLSFVSMADYSGVYKTSAAGGNNSIIVRWGK